VDGAFMRLGLKFKNPKDAGIVLVARE